MEIIVVALLFSAIFVCLVVVIAQGRWPAGGACCLSGLAIVPLLCFSPLLALQSLLTFLATLVCVVFRLKAKSVIASAVAAAAISYAVVIVPAIGRIRLHRELLEKYPLVSVADRLAYEKPRQPRKTSGDARESLATLKSPLEARLDQMEQRAQFNSRGQALESLHDRASERFVMGQGFGYVRMRSFVPDSDLPEQIAPIPLPERPYVPDGGFIGGRLADAAKQTPSALLRLHATGLDDFLEPERMGYVKNREQVAGFLSHGFTKMPAVGGNANLLTDWILVRLELISLLKHEVPVAYLSKHLPRMDELKDAPTRELDFFERKALDRLRTDEGVVIDEQPGGIRMVGSIRAAKHCLECHSARRGELLGAFSYEFVPKKAAPVKRATGPRA